MQAFEDSLGHFYTALDDCKTLCDGSIMYDGTHDFSQVTKIVSLKELWVTRYCIVPVCSEICPCDHLYLETTSQSKRGYAIHFNLY